MQALGGELDNNDRADGQNTRSAIDATLLKPRQFRAGLRQFDTRILGVAPKQRGDVADPLDQRRPGRRADFSDHGLARFAILGVHPDFDQFVMIERQQDFVQDRWRDAAVADDHDRLAGMSQGFEMTLPRIGERKHESYHDG